MDHVDWDGACLTRDRGKGLWHSDGELEKALCPDEVGRESRSEGIASPCGAVHVPPGFVEEGVIEKCDDGVRRLQEIDGGSTGEIEEPVTVDTFMGEQAICC
jgi:hypothetical protein